MAAAASLRQTKMTILLSLNAAAILIAGVLIAGAIWLNGGLDFRVVAERSDEIDGEVSESQMIGAESNSNTELTEAKKAYITSVRTNDGIDSSPVPDGELWAGDSIFIYQTANVDICVGGDLTNLGDMYWQTSNADVISGFYPTARTWLGYSSDTCRFPLIAGVGKTTITAGTYDGARRDSIDVYVLEVPTEKWKYEVLSLVNQERVRNGLEKLVWGDACASAAEVRAEEIVELYSHTRPDGSSWDTACVEPSGFSTYVEGENLVVGNSAVSPETVVAAWMNSEKHRENILNPDFTKLAVGFYFDPGTKYQTHWSQYFSNF
ncbi:CAP domain-containing protein [Candidatus Saccharibacteria bacterium]|nr:CAP domain-containing protein [Candidatus Saccharibacteria bacterium]MBR0424222.1 CAP domain-containing protein [Candidatus Saccharibacteria bacterium]